MLISIKKESNENADSYLNHKKNNVMCLFYHKWSKIWTIPSDGNLENKKKKELILSKNFNVYGSPSLQHLDRNVFLNKS